MKLQQNTDTKAMKMEKLQSELNRAKLNEQRLKDQNTEQKKRLAELVTADIALKKEPGGGCYTKKENHSQGQAYREVKERPTQCKKRTLGRKDQQG